MGNPLSQYTLDELRQRRSMKWRQYPDDVLPLWVAEMDTPPAEPIRAALAAALDRGDLGYSTPGGAVEAFAGFAGTRYGWTVDPADARLSPNVMLGVSEVLRHVTRPGDGVVVNPPVYPPFYHYIPDAGRRIIESPLVRVDGQWTLDLERLERDFADASAYLLCNPQNPTGVAYSRSTLLAIADLAERYDVRVLVDEIHAPLTYPGVSHVPFLSLDTAASHRAIAFHSASKAWNLAGLTTAIIVGGPGARADLDRISHNFGDAVGIFGVLATEAAFAHGTPWLDSLLAGLDANRQLLGDLLRSSLPTVGYVQPQATYLAWLDCSELGLGDDPAAVFLERGRVAFNAGNAFGKPGAGHVRLNLATSGERVEEGVRRMVATLS
ncbi:aminotransferase class I/II-fold pyridoxal phosphate-dependent enzyme [Longispora sp. NPDC051575]|uniref:MalY/PatB family protein n=1 Tax=Longispora sp. NPDC051575 TaxID=3154943 RepID=UPI003440B620